MSQGTLSLRSRTLDVQRFGLLFLVGAAVGTLGDRVHTFAGVLHYPKPFVFDEAWWVPFLMGGAGVFLPTAHALVDRLRRDVRQGAPQTATMPDVMTAFLWFAGAYAASGVFKAHPIALAIVFTATFVVRALALRISSMHWTIALCTGLGGTLFESALSSTGAFAYLEPSVVGVPIWLAGLYLHLALLVRAIDCRWPEAETIVP
jgi:hypothetical protein